MPTTPAASVMRKSRAKVDHPGSDTGGDDDSKEGNKTKRYA
ncbi:hypothetical protein PAB09_05585 [Corynebacterium sp. SCR221107]|nr:hypothetical protein [Corynebacterium sp. SCR221107]WBT09765.1 hypothetical protein PAB09_05585 [Corynebacterium sp. SCR221107]